MNILRKLFGTNSTAKVNTARLSHNYPSEFYPWENVDASRNDALLQAKNTLDPSIIKGIKSCPNCGLASEQLSWFWFSSPQEDWDALAGRAGWMSVCDACHIQVEFLNEIMS